MEDTKLPKWRDSFIRYAPFFLWIGVIFYLSSPEGSFNQTSRFIGPLIHFFFPDISPENQALIHLTVRKCAHFIEYAVLALLAVRAFAASTSTVLREKRFFFALLMVVLIASLDETNQSFEASRSGSIWDVLLDISGGLVMTITLWLFRRRILPAAND